MKFFIYCRKSQEAEDRQVLSLQSQESEVAQLVVQSPDIEIAGTYLEAFSAKAPGRVEFNKMLDAIERGEADGILAWHPDRLARNSMDGGRIIYLLDQGKLKDLRFCTYSFENNSQGKFMLNIIFGYSKYYVDSLSENVKRGQRTKIRNGWMPNKAPLGYRNCRESGHILPHEPHFGTVRRFFELILTGKHSVEALHRMARDDWAYVTPVRKTTGGKVLSKSQLHRLLRNPLYAGYIPWNGKLYPGLHDAVVTKDEFQRVQAILGQLPQTRPKSRAFAYRGLLTCGACGKAVTAEFKRKPSGRTYTYYHCTRVHTSPKCMQPSIEERDLADQIDAFLTSIHIPAYALQWLLKAARRLPDRYLEDQKSRIKRLEAKTSRLKTQLSNLTDIRLRDLIDDVEYEEKRTALQRELDVASQTLAETQSPHEMFEPAETLLKLSDRAISLFNAGDAALRARLLKTLCSNPVLIDKKARLEAVFPFEDLRLICESPGLRGERDGVRTPSDKKARTIVAKIRQAATTVSEDDLVTMNALLKAGDDLGALDHRKN